MARRKYSDSDKARALAALDLNEGNVLRTATAIGIPHKTLDEWSKARHQSWEVAELRNEQKKDLADKIETLVHTIVDAMPDKIEKAGLSACSISMGVGIDKMRLLRGQPTDIIDLRAATAKAAEALGIPPEELESLLPIDGTEHVS